MKTILPVLFVVLGLLLLSGTALGLTTNVTIVWGNVTIGTSSATGAVIDAYLGGKSAPEASFAVGSQGTGVPSGYYQADISCDNSTTDSSTVFVKVWGINGTVVGCIPNSYRTQANISVSAVADGAACGYANACSGGFCCSGSSSINTSGGSGTCGSSACSSGSSDGGGGSGSGGGGAAGGGGGGAGPVSETSAPVAITGPTSTAVSFTKASDIGVETIELKTTASAAVSNGQVTVKETNVDKATSSAIETSTQKVYKYLSISKVNIKDSDIQSAKIKFEVPASWFASNNIAPGTVKLNHLVSGKWVALATKLVSSDGSKSVYEAETPGFSTFAISGEQKLSAFQIIDAIRGFYAGTSKYTAFDIIDMIRKLYA